MTGRARFIAAMTLFWLLGSAGAYAACPRPGVLNATSELYVHDPRTAIAIGGYDAVAYTVDNKARKGKDRHQLVWCGVVWLFANEGNLEAFRHDPEVYAPRLGGYGAMAAARGRLTPGSPQIWTRYNNRLYFFYSEANRYVWLQKPKYHCELSEKGWPKLRKLLVH
ncbi:YHS domain-containing (seleno)protein [Coralliovum pocilloporae]|uniref:YHS domain-containing (seleno)protein n=1 Tax=Coralliovum pocilloporae TaxID=3066369 RepID=UPI003306BF38